MVDTRTLAIFAPFLGASLYGLSYALSERVFGVISLASYILASSIMGLVAVFCLHLCTTHKVDFSALRDPSLACSFFIAIVASLAAWLATIFAIKNISANYASIAEISYPLFTVFFGYLIFGRKLDWSMALGAVLVLAGSYLIVSDKLNGR